MKKVFLLFLILAIPSISCASGRKPLVQVDNQLAKLQAEEMNGMKADIAKMQNDLKLNNEAVAGVNNKIQNLNVGRDNIVTNDKEIFEAQIELYKYQSKVWMRLFLSILAILSFTVKFLLNIFKKYLFHKEELYMRINTEEERKYLKELQKSKSIFSMLKKEKKQ